METENKRIPFDWDKYQSGEFEITCRNGIKPEIAGYNHDAKSNNKIVYWANNSAYARNENGLVNDDGDESEYDLFLIPKPKRFQAWVNLFTNGSISGHTDKELAEKLAQNMLNEHPNKGFELVECRLIEWEG
jgi:hypothetical protein